jgi:acyl-CoA hydrolase
MLHQKDPSQPDPVIEAKVKELEALEMQKAEEAQQAKHEEDLQSAHDEAIDESEFEIDFPSAEEIRQKTLDFIKQNAALAVKKESTEILKTAMKAIEFAIANEKFNCELGGPGRPEPGSVVLRQSYGAYHEDARKFVLKRLTEQGFKVQEVDDVYIKIAW